ncbi:MAG: helix-turn-helix domain-containing protein [Clostridiales bacterium]|nr:helix-turn-helix domain-containing protein [Clostridiales bacterium]
MRKYSDFPSCPIATFTMLMGNKWKLMIIRDLINGETFFGDLKRDLTGISHKVLTENLRALEDDGLIHRTVHEGKVVRVSYGMTEFGMTLAPIYSAIANWGTEYKKHFYGQDI